jgi:hypothetical protein
MNQDGHTSSHSIWAVLLGDVVGFKLNIECVRPVGLAEQDNFWVGGRNKVSEFF